MDQVLYGGGNDLCVAETIQRDTFIFRPGTFLKAVIPRQFQNLFERSVNDLETVLSPQQIRPKVLEILQDDVPCVLDEVLHGIGGGREQFLLNYEKLPF